MGVSLFLNKRKVDLYKKPITRKIQIANIQEVTERKSSYSYTIKLPKTARNVELFDLLGISGNVSRKPYERIVADYVVDGFSLVVDGYAVVKGAGEYYEVNIFDGVLSLSNLLKDDKIVDLPLKDLNHKLTVSSYLGSLGNTEGFVYAYADFGRGVELNSVRLEKQAPSIFVHTIFRRIFESRGLNLVGDFFTENTDYLNEVLTPSKGYEVDLWGLENELIGRCRSGKLTGSVPVNSTDDVVDGYDEDVVVSLKDSNGDFSVVNGDVVINKSSDYRFDYDINSEISSGDVYPVLNIFLNGGFLNRVGVRDGLVEERQVYTLVQGDVLNFVYSNVHATTANEDIDIVLDYEVRVNFNINLQGGVQVVKPSDYISDIRQIDFLKDVVNRYGLVLNPVSGTNDYRFERIEDLLKNRSEAEDWTEKLSSIKGESYVSGYAQINKAVYQYDDSEEEFSFDGQIVVQDENAEYSKNIIESKFQIPLKSEFDEDVDVYSLPLWKFEEERVFVDFYSPIQEVERFENSRIQIGGSFGSYTGGVVSYSGRVVKKYRASDLLDAGTLFASSEIEDSSGVFSFKQHEGGDIFSFNGSQSGETRYTKSNSLAGNSAGGLSNPNVQPPIEFVYLEGDYDFEPNYYERKSVWRNTVEEDAVKPSIMSLNRSFKNVNVKKFEDGVVSVYSGDFPELSLNNMSMQYFLNSNYPSFNLLINDFKKLVLLVNLSVVDIYNLDFFRLKYFKQLGRYCYLNSVKNTTGKISEVEVVEIRNFI